MFHSLSTTTTEHGRFIPLCLALYYYLFFFYCQQTNQELNKLIGGANEMKFIKAQ
jgi:hypothetical protein